MLLVQLVLLVLRDLRLLVVPIVKVLKVLEVLLVLLVLRTSPSRLGGLAVNCGLRDFGILGLVRRFPTQNF